MGLQSRRSILVTAAIALALCITVSAASGATPESPDTVGDVGATSSLALDGAGNPVVSYRDTTNQDLKVLHCNDPNCAGGDESIESPDTDGNVGAYTSLELDAAGNPVVSYYDTSNGDLKLLHCYVSTCVTGGTVERVALAGNVGQWTSLALDGAGKPVISYLDSTNSALKVVHCDIASCADGQISEFADNAGDVGSYSSLVLDAAGNPVISYHDATNDNNGDLKVLHCDTPTCAAPPLTSITPFAPPTGTNGWFVTDVTAVVNGIDPEVVETRCVLDPAVAPLTFDEIPTGCGYLGAGTSIAADGEHVLYAASLTGTGTKETPVGVSFKIDQTDPLVAYSGGAATYTVDAQVNITCAATDGVSGIASTTCVDVVGSAASFGLGVHSSSASAIDNAGNTNTGSVGFTVTVTPASLCNLTLALAQGSARYLGSTALQQNAFNQVVSVICAVTLTPIKPGISAAKKRALIAAYKFQLNLLVAGTWLTQAQASSLGGFTSGL